MTDTINTRELIMNILLEMDREKTPCHLAVRDALDKYQFLPRHGPCVYQAGLRGNRGIRHPE